jgi:hypothetical protein
VASLHQHGTPGAFGTATGGLPTPVAANVDGTWLTVDRHVPGREWWVAHDLAGRGIASDLLVGRSDDNGTTWRIVVANPPTDAGAQQVPQRLADDGPNVMAPVAVDPRDPGHVAVVYSAESQQDAEQGHSADAVDSYEWDTGVYAVSSRDGGLTWTAATVVDTGQPAVGTGHDEYSDTAGWFPSVTWTADGTLYATYAMRAAHTTRWVAMLSRSLDGGQRWSRPIPVSAPGQQAFSPTIASEGHQVAMAWFGSATRDNEGADGRWRLVGATIRWPSNRPRPCVSRYDLTSAIRTGPMVPLGPRSARSWRNLDLSLDGTGRAWVPYALQQGATAQRRLLAWRY